MTTEPYTLGEYRLERRLGVGGMAEVWRAVHRRTGDEAAVKVMLAAANQDTRLRESFVKEARSHAGLDHPRIVQLLDYGVATEEDALWDEVVPGDPYLAMELATGTLRDQMPTTWSELRKMLEDVLDGLAYSHARGFVHRDLKPENVLVTEDGYKLADFGIAHSVNLDETADRDTLTTTIGTPQYMAPEQFRGEWFDFGPWTDLYALGCLAYEVAARRAPFTNTALFALAVAHIGEQVPSLTPVIEVPEGFEAWLRVLLAKRSADRFRFAADARAALDALSKGFESRVSYDGPGSPRSEIEHDAETLIDAFSTLALGLTMDADYDPMPTEPSIVTPHGLVAAAPLPSDWRRDDPRELRSARLGLFRFRELPLVGFDEERDRLWSVLREVVELGEQRIVVLRGAERAPVSDLGNWFSQRIAECGAAVTRATFYTRTGGPREGIVALLEDIVGTWGMRDDEVGSRVRRYVEAHVAGEASGPVARVVELMIGMARGADVRGVLPSRAERYRAIAEVLSGSSSGRPYALWCDDVQWGTESVSLAEQLAGTAPGLVVLGLSGTMEPQHEEQLERLLELPNAQLLDVREATIEEARRQARALIRLDPSLEERLVRLTQTDATALRLLVEDLRLSESLETGPSGYQLTSHATPPIAVDQVFHRALDRYVQAAPHLVRALEVAAVLGRAPDPDELRRVCDAIGVSWEGLSEGLVDHGLAAHVGQRWWFVHDALVAAVCERMRADGRLAETHDACAHALLARRRPGVDELVRASRHLQNAGQARQALGPLFRAMRALLTEDVRRVDALLVEHSEITAQLGLAPESPEALEGDFIRYTRLSFDGLREVALEGARSVVARAVATNHVMVLGLALRLQARLCVESRDLVLAAQLLQRAEDVAVRMRDRGEQAAAARVLGQVYDRLGSFDEACRALERAVRLYDEVGDSAGKARAMAFLASILLTAGDRDGARRWSESAVVASRDAGGAGEAEAAAMLGEIARLDGDWSKAREWYVDARAKYAIGARINLQIMDLNIAMVDLAEGNYGQAHDGFSRLSTEFRYDGRAVYAAIAMAGEGACYCGLGNLPAARQSFEDLHRMTGDRQNLDVVDVLELGVQATGAGPGSVLVEALERERSKT